MIEADQSEADAEFERLQELSARYDRGEEVSDYEWASVRRSRPDSVLPTRPFAAYLFRRFSSFADALKEWRVQRPSLPQRISAANKIIGSLGTRRSPDYEKALREAEALANGLSVDDPAERMVATEVRDEILPLLWAYKDPVRFFSEVAPPLWPYDFVIEESQEKGLNLHSRIGVLSSALHTWGSAAFLNPEIRTAFRCLTPAEFGQVLSAADSKRSYNDGPPPGATKGNPKAGRPPKKARRASAIVKQIYREGKRKKVS